jgi:[acyl-carrier-protein] S-malonyltransferase
LSDKPLAFIFPAFTSDYTDHPGRNMAGFPDRFNEFLNLAADFDPGLSDFTFTGNTYLDDELRTQYLTYIYSCSVSSLLRQNRLAADISAGYSMGIYAALFDTGSVNFETGLELIRTAYHALCQSQKNRQFGMGTLIGLDRRDIQQINDQSSLGVEITNQNASHSFVVSGYRDEIQKLMELAKEEGALHTRDLAVSIPYHSTYLKANALDFANRIGHLTILAPQTPVISLIDQLLLTTPGSIRRELSRNLFYPLNWYHTMQVMVNGRDLQFIECGPSVGLAKNARFVEGIRFSPLSSILP